MILHNVDRDSRTINFFYPVRYPDLVSIVKLYSETRG